MQSLRLETDPRFKAIKHYTTSDAAKNHLQNLAGRVENSDEHIKDSAHKNLAPRKTMNHSALVTDIGLLQEQTLGLGPDDTSFAEVVQGEMAWRPEAPMNQQKYAVEDRLEWQGAFDRSVKRLMVDFTLSPVPHCRLNHLERMHTWFSQHGAKQVRKAAQPPNFVTANRDVHGRPEPGSARNIPGKLGGTALILAGSVAMRRSKNVPEGPGAYATGPQAPRSHNASRESG